MTFHDNSKNENRKIGFLFDSALCASVMKMGAKLRGGGSAYRYLGQGHHITCLMRYKWYKFYTIRF